MDVSDQTLLNPPKRGRTARIQGQTGLISLTLARPNPILDRPSAITAMSTQRAVLLALSVVTLSAAAAAYLLLAPAPGLGRVTELCDQGDQVLERGDNLGALVYYQGAAELHPASFRAHLGIATAQNRRRLFSDALTALQNAGRAAGDNAPNWLSVAEGYLEARAADRSIQACRTAIGLDPRSGEAWRRLARAYVEAAETDSAVACYRRAEDLSGRSARVHAGLAGLFSRSGAFDSVASRFTQALELDPGNLTFRCGLAEARLMQGGVSEALSSLDRIVDEDPHNVRARFLRGRAFVLLGDDDRARQELAIFERQKKLVDRIAFLEKAEAEHPTAEGYQMLAHLYSVRGQDSLAADRLRRATAIDPMVTVPQITAQPGTY